MWSWSSNSVKTHHPRYPNVNLNSISLYKGVFMEPLGDKFLCPIASLGWHLSVEYNGLVHILNNTYLQHQTWLHDYDGHAGMRQQSLKEKILTFFIWKEFEYLLLDWALRPSYHWFNPWLVSISLSCFLFVALHFYQHFEPEPTSYKKIESSNSFSCPLLSLFNFNSGTIWKLKEILHCNEVSSI